MGSGVVGVLAAGLIWEVVVRGFGIPPYLLPSVSAILAEVYQGWTGLLQDAGITLLEAALGFFFGAGLAFVIGAIFVHAPIIERSASPLFVAFQSVPIVAIAPLLIIWLGNGLASKVVLAAVICFFPMVINSAAALKRVPPEALDLMRLHSASWHQVFFKLRLPHSLPFIFSALKVSATLSVVGAVVAEFAGANAGIGFRIIVASYRTDTPALFAAVFFSALTGIFFFVVVGWIERLVLRTHGTHATEQQ